MYNSNRLKNKSILIVSVMCGVSFAIPDIITGY